MNAGRYQNHSRASRHRLQQRIDQHVITQVVFLKMRLNSIRRKFPILCHDRGKANDPVNGHGEFRNGSRCRLHGRQLVTVGGDEDDLGLGVFAVDVVDDGLEFRLRPSCEYDTSCSAMSEGICCRRS